MEKELKEMLFNENEGSRSAQVAAQPVQSTNEPYTASTTEQGVEAAEFQEEEFQFVQYLAMSQALYDFDQSMYLILILKTQSIVLTPSSTIR